MSNANPAQRPACLPEHLQTLFEQRRAAFVQALLGAGLPASFEAPPSLPAVWAASDFVAESCRRYPAAFLALLDSGRLSHPATREDLAAAVDAAVADAGPDEAAFMSQLRRVRHLELVRIAWRDLAGDAWLSEVLAELSWLAEACIEAALRFAETALDERYGHPCDEDGRRVRLCVLGLGKLGGGELNFSSDIDLIFAYATGGDTQGAKPLDRQQYFIRLGQRLIKLLTAQTADGFVYRVDLRLRAFGDSGPLAMSCAATEDYYQTHGREWERYALIKARVVAGDAAAGKALLRNLRPFVYRRYLDYGVFQALREMKDLINQEAARRGKGHDVKLSPGGIREVEFIGQAFQLIRGGRDAGLQLRGIRDVLARLVERDLLPAWAEAQLQAAYAFLRRVENRLQMTADQQTHALPDDEPGRARLAWSMGYTDWPAFRTELSGHMRRVHEHFEQVFATPQAVDESDASGRRLLHAWRRGAPDELLGALADAGYAQPQEAAAHLQTLRTSNACRSLSETGRARLDHLIPLLVRAVAAQARPEAVLERVLGVIQTIARRSVYLALLVESPLALSQLVKLCAASPWIARQLGRLPLLLDELLDPRSLYTPPDRAALADELADALRDIEPDDLEGVMDRLRQFKETQVLRVAAADVTGVLPLMRVSDQLTWIAEVILERVVCVARDSLAARHGEPRLHNGDAAGFGIVGYGKLGGIELGYGSDLDVVFLYHSDAGSMSTDGERPLDAAVFFARLAQRIVHMLTAYTPAGLLYEVDMRLRPSGAAGLLVSSLQAYATYQQTQAWTWEHQALVRARFIAGTPGVGDAFGAVRAATLARARDLPALRREVREMRERMWRELGSADPQRFDLKKDPGGIADIEFLVQYSVLAHAHAHPELLRYTDNIRILDTLSSAGLLGAGEAAFLADAFRTLRDHIHALTLQAEPAVVDAADYATLRNEIGRLWRQHLDDND
ncbi:bifunctional [glutamate--ammonia ligase]-adenylyl-L-tyrosine phosphorylase/[glutamate--ammonia-ligase] adenylyltransferase [Acidihalobacter ferrooxydans]|uniref:Bifunctional glutamine synthetase adenylyltransferase/adenylyl-removing enzyme n=1 Tax=Acidihalobacter ferrooxydans TaxID=1765967 RepID=A0A1P8UE27_9GAMM|nr:bifunctional [glutamate--ammonia ligase]-adenylyl-L-tyrosine phosphorylase/[glutamate--ammonia-ligase] adenylyltransferase [Acidihalobacter ferrooxydans]APZ42117.1 bifunctional glutamine synthetase adenylyltransferase/deadenyltransferase [Acidihalobacter ferrooxydans]